MRVLVVDDDVFVTMSLKTILESDEKMAVILSKLLSEKFAVE